MRVLLVNICKEKLHYFEFVKPIEDIIEDKFFVKNYKDINKLDLEKADKIIICGTSLKDCEFSSKDNLKYFEWIKTFQKPVLGICGGMQVVGLIFGGKLKKKTEIGFFTEDFKKDFLGLSGNQEVYHLHNNYISGWGSDWSVFAGKKIVQAIKHKEKKLYGVLFHPEVRQKQLILEFVKNG